MIKNVFSLINVIWARQSDTKLPFYRRVARRFAIKDQEQVWILAQTILRVRLGQSIGWFDAGRRTKPNLDGRFVIESNGNVIPEGMDSLVIIEDLEKIQNLEEFLLQLEPVGHEVLLFLRVPGGSKSGIASKFPVDKTISVFPSDPLKTLSTSQEECHLVMLRYEKQGVPLDCGIIIPHWESYPFASACLKEIKKCASIKEHIYLIDDGSQDGSYERLIEEWKSDPEITFIQAFRPNKEVPDVGWLLDFALKQVKERYVAMIDADVYPISDDWLRFPIWLLQRYGCSSVGCDTGLSNAYTSRFVFPQRWRKKEYIPQYSLYDNSRFTCTNNFYRIMETGMAQVVADYAGFYRRSLIPAHSFSGKVRNRLIHYFSLIQTMVSGRYTADADNGVIANLFIDENRLGPKFSLPITSYLGKTPSDGVFGQNVCSLIFHFALSTRALSRWRREVSNAGLAYQEYVCQIFENGITHDLLHNMVTACKFTEGGFDGATSDELHADMINALQAELNEYWGNK